MTAIRIRAATPEDREFMFDQAQRLAAVAELPWHAERDVLAFQHRYMNAAFARPESEAACFIADDQTSQRLGYVFGEGSTDFVTLEPCAYVTVLAVIERPKAGASQPGSCRPRRIGRGRRASA